MHWTVEKKLFGKSLNLEYLATRNVFLLLNKFGTILTWNIWQEEMFFCLWASLYQSDMFGNKKCFLLSKFWTITSVTSIDWVAEHRPHLWMLATLINIIMCSSNNNIKHIFITRNKSIHSFAIHFEVLH